MTQSHDHEITRIKMAGNVQWSAGEYASRTVPQNKTCYSGNARYRHEILTRISTHVHPLPDGLPEFRDGIMQSATLFGGAQFQNVARDLWSHGVRRRIWWLCAHACPFASL